MGDESEPVTTWRERVQHSQTMSGHDGDFILSLLFYCSPHSSVWRSPYIYHFCGCDIFSELAVKPQSPSFLISGLCNVFHVLISRPFPCGRTLLSHLSSLISPRPPQSTAPLRLVRGGQCWTSKGQHQLRTQTCPLLYCAALCPLSSPPQQSSVAHCTFLLSCLCFSLHFGDILRIVHVCFYFVFYYR